MVSLSNSSRLPANASRRGLNPVTFLPGRARLSTSPDAMGSDDTPKKTIGIVLVAFLAALGLQPPGSDEYVNLETDQLISQGGEPVELIISVSILDSYVLALDIPELTELSPYFLSGGRSGTGSEKANLSYLCRLLRLGGEANSKEHGAQSQTKHFSDHNFPLTPFV
jgi:hypothetical protein